MHGPAGKRLSIGWTEERFPRVAKLSGCEKQANRSVSLAFSKIFTSHWGNWDFASAR
jgi:hypothetical protein